MTCVQSRETAAGEAVRSSLIAYVSRTSRNEPRPRGETVAPTDRSEGCRVHVLHRLTHPARTLTHFATVTQVYRPKTHTMIFGLTTLPRHIHMAGEPPTTSCSVTSTPSSRYTSGRPDDGPTRPAGRFAPKYPGRCVQPWRHGQILKRLLRVYERAADVSLGCDIRVLHQFEGTNTETTRFGSYKQKYQAKT